jgi:hypothetical protein
MGFWMAAQVDVSHDERIRVKRLATERESSIGSGG